MTLLNKTRSLQLIKVLSAEGSHKFFVTGSQIEYVGATTSKPISTETAVAEDIVQSQQVLSRTGRRSATNYRQNCDGSNGQSSLSMASRRLLLSLTAKEPAVEFCSILYHESNITSGSARDCSQKELITRGHIKIDKIQIGKGYSNVWIATEQGFAEIGIPVPSHKWIGGEFHSWLNLHVTSSPKLQPFHICKEYRLEDGCSIDFVARRESDLWCFEVGLPPLDKEVHNCLKIWRSTLNPTKVVHIVKDSRDRKELAALLAQESKLDMYRGKIEIRLVGEFTKPFNHKQRRTSC